MKGIGAIMLPLPGLGSPITVGIGFIIAVCAAQLLYRFFTVRMQFRRLKAQGIVSQPNPTPRCPCS
jgi:hypothetical protein